jgi:hypothetical protein
MNSSAVAMNTASIRACAPAAARGPSAARNPEAARTDVVIIGSPFGDYLASGRRVYMTSVIAL